MSSQIKNNTTSLNQLLESINNLPSIISEDSEGAYNQGLQDSYDNFWDTLQSYGARTSYACAFGGWTDNIFKPKYNFQVKDGYMMFRSSRITDLTNIVDKNGNSITLDFSQNTNSQYMFQWATGIKYIGIFDTRSQSSGFNYTFAYAEQLRSIEKIILKDDGSQNLAKDMFTNAIRLEEIRFEGTIGKTLSFQWSTKLSKESIISIINALSQTTSGLALTFSDTAVKKAFETSEGLADGSTSNEWVELISTRANWTITLV